jgi:hypothetical protein
MFYVHSFVSRPLRGLFGSIPSNPSAKALGYFRSVRFADENKTSFEAKPWRPAAGQDLTARRTFRNPGSMPTEW